MGEPAAAIASPERVEADESTGRIRSGKLAGLSMGQAIWVLSWPVLIESFLNSLVGVTDTVLSAGVSEAATDAIGAAAYFLWFIGLIGMALGVGGTALISRAVGKGRTAAAGTVVAQCVTLSVLSGIGVGLFVAAVASTVADWMNLQGEAARSAILYIQVTAIAVPMQTLLAVGISCCRGAGDSMRPLGAMIVVNLVNLVFAFMLSGVDLATAASGPGGETVRRVWLANPFGFDLGVAGIAWGTVIAWTVGAMLIVGFLARGVHGVKLRRRRLAPHWHTIRRLVKVGVPNFLETFGMWLGNFLTILMVGWMKSPGALGAHMVAVRVEAFSFLPGFAMSLAAATLAGQYLGAGSPRLARRAVWRCTWIACALMGLTGAVFIAWPRALVGLLSQQEVHLNLAPPLLVIAGLVQAPFAVSIVLRSALRGAGATTQAMWITWICTWLVRLPLAWLCCGVDCPLPGGGMIVNPAPLQSWWGVRPLEGFWIGLCLEILARAIAFLVVFVRGSWARMKV